MKKLVCLLSLLPLLFCGCSDSDEIEQSPSTNVLRVNTLGEKVTNPTNSQWCKSSTAEATLSSVRRISDRFYKMDYLTELPLDQLVDGDYRTHDAFETAFDKAMFTPEGYENAKVDEGTACSGFVCWNEKGEILLGRNFDGDGGPLMLIHNKANGFKFVQFTDPHYNSILFNSADREHGDGILSDGKTSLHRLLREPLATMDGMNEYGLCFGAYQLPSFDEHHPGTPLAQNTGKKAIASSLMHNLILARCKTVKDVEVLLKSHDMVNIVRELNVHWMMADATGDWALFEYWKDELHVYREADLIGLSVYVGTDVPYEWYSIENYYRTLEPYSAYPKQYVVDDWQVMMSGKKRVGHMMNFYKPTMSEMDALRCLQEGRYDLEVPHHMTNWSCVYNPTQKTVLFALRNDMSQVYKVDLKEDLK